MKKTKEITYFYNFIGIFLNTERRFIDMKIKVLVTVGSMSIGGNEVFTINLAKNIDRSKFDLDVLIYSDNGMNYEFVNELKKCSNNVFIYPSINQNKFFMFVKDINITKNILIQGKYNIIHCNSCSFLGLLKGVISVKSLGKVKIIAHSHNEGNEKNNFIDQFLRKCLKKYLSRSIDYGFACSDVAGKSKYTDEFINSSKYILINNAIDINKYKFNEEIRKEVRYELGIEKENFVIGNIGRLDYQKNQKYLIKILKELLDKGNNVKLLLIGSGQYEENLKKLAKNLHIENNIIWLGSRTDAYRFYNAMDCFVMTSRYEGFPFVMTEAQVNGLYCVVSDVISKSVNITGMVEFVSLNAPFSKWAATIENVLHGRMPKSATQKIIDKYDIKKEIVKIEKIYISLAQRELHVKDKN